MHKSRLTAVGLSAGIMLSTINVAEANKPGMECSNRSLLGTYMYAFVGFYEDAAGKRLLYQSVGIEYFDGQGKVRISHANSLGNSPGDYETFEADYQIDANCVGRIEYDEGAPDRIFVDPKGGHFTWIDTNEGAFKTSRDDRTSLLKPGHCSLATLKGTYSYSLFGSGNKASFLADLFAEAGLESFDGAGHLLNKYRDSDGVEEVVAGSYQINADCSGTATYGSGSDARTYQIFVGPSGQDMVFIDREVDFIKFGKESRISQGMLVQPQPSLNDDRAALNWQGVAGPGKK